MPASGIARKEANLARVRENQRRCRARRREYIAELESKTQTVEQARLELQSTAQNLARENRILRDLLISVGFDDDFQEQHISAEIARLESTTERSSPGARTSDGLPLLLPRPREKQMLIPDSSTGAIAEDIAPLEALEDPRVTGPTEQSIDFPDLSSNLLLSPRNSQSAGSDCILNKLLSTTQGLSPNQTISTSFDQTNNWSQGDFLELFPTIAIPNPCNVTTEEQTTLCSVAYEMVMKHNKKQYNEAELNIKLCKGFRSAQTPLEGCRVENKILFSVLAEIC